MKNYFSLLFLLFQFVNINSNAQSDSVKLTQTDEFNNILFLKSLYQTSSYIAKKNKVDWSLKGTKTGTWGEFIKGVDVDLITKNKTIALTFDACGGKNGDEYDKDIVDYLTKENIPATIFFTGKWIDANFDSFVQISKTSLFEIENHGLNHKPCSIGGEEEYGIKGTPDIPDAFDEIEANEQKIEKITGRRPLFYRSATAFTDEGCVKLAQNLGVTIISFDVLSGDAIPFTPTNIIVKNVLKGVRDLEQ